MTDLYDMRGLIDFAEHYYGESQNEEEAEIADDGLHDRDDDMILELEHIVFRLRALTESGNPEYVMGVEDGMARAADMIENLIKKYEV